MCRTFLALSVATFTLATAHPTAAQDPGNDTAAPESPAPPTGAPPSIFDGDWVTLGAGVGYSSSYDGSDDYVVSPLPFLQGKLGGVAINPRPAGVGLDFIDDAPGAPIGVALGVAARVNRNRVSQIEDPVVSAYGKLETAIEVGPTAGVTVNGILHQFDSISLSVDALWDVNGAHKGRTITPSITYFTPLSRGIAVGLSLSARHVDDDYADYYYSVPVIATLAPSNTLPAFTASGGFDKIGANVIAGYDFDNDITNGGLAAFMLVGWSKMQGDGARTPFTAIRGSADQWFVGAGLGYSF